MILRFTFLGLLSLIATALYAQNIFVDPTHQKIWEAKDRSDTYYTLKILKSGTQQQKILALKGLYSWHDSMFRKPLSRMAKKGKEELKIGALEAIGQSRDSFYIRFLYKVIRRGASQNVKEAALVAFGKCITKSKIKLLHSIKNTDQPGYAEGMYRALLKGVADSILTTRVCQSLMGAYAGNKFYASWYLGRTGFKMSDENTVVIYENLMQGLKSNKISSELSIPLILAVGKSNWAGKDSALRELYRYFLNVPNKKKPAEDCLNMVSVFRALGLQQKPAFASDLNPSPLLRYPSFQMAYSELLNKDCSILNSNTLFTYNPAIVNILKNTSCPKNRVHLQETKNLYGEIWKISLLETSYANYPQLNQMLMQTEVPAIKSAATEALINCRNLKGFPEYLESDFVETMELLIKDGDEGVLSIIANAILDKKIKAEESYTALFAEAQKKLKLPIEMEAFIDIAKVLAKIQNIPYKKPLPEWNHPIEWDYVSGIDAKQKIKVITSKGDFVIQLNVNRAPGSVSSILKLVESGFYDGKYFHRLVPNFVIQGGCPRGDGFGGAEYSIRSEFSNLKYSEGAVGLASSGPDTESCQWFVTHCPTPHLDGRYTIIGYVVEGMEVIQNLGVGDQMIKVIKL